MPSHWRHGFLVNVHEVDAAHGSELVLSQERLAEQSFPHGVDCGTTTV